jgi:hypothetical protein
VDAFDPLSCRGDRPGGRRLEAAPPPGSPRIPQRLPGWTQPAPSSAMRNDVPAQDQPSSFDRLDVENGDAALTGNDSGRTATHFDRQRSLNLSSSATLASLSAEATSCRAYPPPVGARRVPESPVVAHRVEPRRV